MKITGAIFDFDGTLMDSMDIWQDVGETYLRYLKMEELIFDPDFVIKPGLRNAVRLALENYGTDDRYNDIVAGIDKHLIERYDRESSPKCDIMQFLEKLKRAGVKMCIATATNELPVRITLRKYGMEKYFDRIFTTENVGKGKNYPDMFYKALEFLGTDRDTTWIFEDAVYSVKTAKAEGLNVVGIYDKSENNAAEMMALSDIYIHNYSELNIE